MPGAIAYIGVGVDGNPLLGRMVEIVPGLEFGPCLGICSGKRCFMCPGQHASPDTSVEIHEECEVSELTWGEHSMSFGLIIFPSDRSR